MTIPLAGALVLCRLGSSATQPGGTVLAAADLDGPHFGNRPPVLGERAWLGLRAAEGVSRLEPVEVIWAGTVEGGDSVFTISVRPAGVSLLLTEVPRVRAGPVSTITHGEQELASGAGIRLSLGGRRYQLRLVAAAPDRCDATVTLTDGMVSQELYFPAEFDVSCDEPHFSLQWAGDLDGDGRLDLVTTLSPKYSFHPRRLFLSSAAPEGKLVGLVAKFDATAA